MSTKPKPSAYYNPSPEALRRPAPRCATKGCKNKPERGKGKCNPCMLKEKKG